jgi:hypothetical protein
MEEYDIRLVGVELTPGLVGNVELGKDTTPVEQEGLLAEVVESGSGRVRGFGIAGVVVAKLGRSSFQSVETRKRHGRVRSNPRLPGTRAVKLARSEMRKTSLRFEYNWPQRASRGSQCGSELAARRREGPARPHGG